MKLVKLINIIIVTILTFCSVNAFCGNPFLDGIEKRTLTEEEKTDLLKYADTSRARLLKAIEEAKGKTVEDASDIYLNVIKKVVIDSYTKHPRTELLMRIALNQALELTYGVPTLSGSNSEKGGVLIGAINEDLLLVILEDSIGFALKYYDTDIEAIKSGNLTDLPFIDYSYERLVLGKKWLSGVFETYYQQALSKVILEHWLNTVMNADELHRLKISEEIIRIEELLEDLLAEEKKDAKDKQELISVTRKLRGEVIRLARKNENVHKQERQKNPTQVSLGGYHTCALDLEGVKCWGDNEYGQIKVPKGLKDPTQISLGGRHTCALDLEGVKCWGYNTYGQIKVPKDLKNPTQVSLGVHHTCALDLEGVKCWGGNGEGQIKVPKDLKNPTQISLGAWHTCALDLEGVKCWGYNGNGQIKVPKDLKNPTQVSLGVHHTCALDLEGVKCWGDNGNGQIKVPKDLKDPTQISLGDYHTCALDLEGVKCWGHNRDGQTSVPESLRFY